MLNFSNYMEIESYMKAVKRELGFDGEDLVFIGMADVSMVCWCEMKAVYANKKWKLTFLQHFMRIY